MSAKGGGKTIVLLILVVAMIGFIGYYGFVETGVSREKAGPVRRSIAPSASPSPTATPVPVPAPT